MCRSPFHRWGHWSLGLIPLCQAPRQSRVRLAFRPPARLQKPCSELLYYTPLYTVHLAPTGDKTVSPGWVLPFFPFLPFCCWCCCYCFLSLPSPFCKHSSFYNKGIPGAGDSMKKSDKSQSLSRRLYHIRSSWASRERGEDVPWGLRLTDGEGKVCSSESGVK